jgi:hypothetical protein
MSLIFRRRLRLGQNLGLNISKSGVSPSYRTKYGSVSFRGISMRTGIPGLTLFQSWGSSKGKSKGANPLQVLLLIVLVVILAYLAIVLVINVLLFLIWLIAEARRGILRWYYRRKMKGEVESVQHENQAIS